MASKSPQNTSAESELGGGKKSPSKKKKMTPEEQSARFIETARALSSDESGKAFEKVIGKILTKD